MKNSLPPKKALYALLLIGVILCSWTRPTNITFSTPPADVTVCLGATASFSVVTSTTPLSYQWQISMDGGSSWSDVGNGSTYSGAASATLSITGTTALFNGYKYRCVATDGTGSYTSPAATLTVGPIGQLTNSSYAICSEGSTNMTSADIKGTYSYQWQVSADNGGSWNNVSDGGDYSGSASAILNISGDPVLNGYLYRTIVTDGTSHCSVTSSGVDTLHVVTKPGVVQPTPTSLSVCSGGSGTISIADSTGVSYQWQVSADNGSTYSNISDNSLYHGTSTYSLAITTPTTPASYQVIRSVTGYGITCPRPSYPVALTFKTPPTITTQPAGKTVCAGSAASFRSVASGTAPTYQWQVSTDGGGSWASVITGATGTTSTILTLTTTIPTMEGYLYRNVATVSGCGSPVTSSAATLHVNSSGTWLGTADTAWENSNNWCGGVPTSATDVLVPASAPRMPLISAGTGTANAHSLTIQKFAKLSISGGTTAITAPFNIAGTVVYMANGNQNIFPADHGSLMIDNAGNKIMQSNVAITDTLTLAGSAMLVTGSNILNMKAGSQPIRGASFSGGQTGWIVTGNGSGGAGNSGVGGLTISQIGAGNGTVLFPVGPTSSTYNPLQLTNGGATNDFTVAVNDQYIPGAATNAVIDRTWLISTAGAGSSNISLGMLWRLGDEPSIFNRSSAAIVRSNGTAIVEESANSAASGSDPYTFSKGAFSTMTQFSVATSTMVILADQLLSFSGEWVSNTSTGLSWNVNPDTESRLYILQHSTDGTSFTDVATLDGEAGKSSYSFYDNHPAMENYYRLKMVGFSGSITFSRIVELSGKEMASKASLAPSVTEQSVASLLLSLGKESDIAYVVTDITGHVMARNAVHLVRGQHSIPVDLSRMQPGVFFVRVTDGQGFNKVLTLVRK